MKTLKIYIILLSLLLTISFWGCRNKITIGYVVYKEYVKGHWLLDKTDKVEEAEILPVTLIVSPPTSEEVSFLWKKSDFKIWVANQKKTVICHIDSITWTTTSCGQKVVVDGSTVLIVKK